MFIVDEMSTDDVIKTALKELEELKIKLLLEERGISPKKSPESQERYLLLKKLLNNVLEVDTTKIDKMEL